MPLVPETPRLHTEEPVVAVVDMTEDMLPAVTRIHLQAFQRYTNARLGPAYATAFLRWFCRRQDAIALVALMEGEAVGYVVGASEGYAKDSSRALLPVAAVAVLRRPWLLLNGGVWRGLWNRLSVMAGRPEEPLSASTLPTPTMALVAIGVAPEARGQRVGTALMDAFERHARDRTMQSLSLDVYAHNGAARRLYEQCGWAAQATYGQALRYEKILRGR